MNSATAIETVTKKVVAEFAAAAEEAGTSRVGIREVALEVEERLPGVTLEQIHKAVLKVAAFYPGNDPQCPQADRQRSFGYSAGWPGESEIDKLIWILKLN